MTDPAAAIPQLPPPDSTPKAALLALVAAICCATTLPLAAQTPGQSVRTVEPRFTRLFGSDSLEMGQPALLPDGRWIVFGAYEADSDNVWVVPTAGGEPVRLTTGRYADDRAVFFPSGDRIAFRSDRPSSPGNPQRYVMVMAFDSRTGRASGPLRQVSLEPTGGSFAVSPDGEWIAYGARQDTAVRVMVIPSSGGTARELARFEGTAQAVANLAWSVDGASVYFTMRHTGSDLRNIMRVSAAGGRTEALGTVTLEARAINAARGLVLLRGASQMPSQEEVFEIATLEGRPVARFAVPRGMDVWNFTPDGRALVAQQSNLVAPIRVVPLAGGPARQLTEAREYDWPIGWSLDGSHLYVSTRANGHGAILELPLNGGPATQWPIPAGAMQPNAISPDGRYIAYGLIEPGSSGERHALVVRRLADGQTRVVTRTASDVPQSWITGPGGGFYGTEPEFFYFERRSSRLQLWATPPEGPSRLLRAFPASYAGRSSFGVYGARIAYSENRGDSTLVFVAEGPNGRPRHLVTVAGSTQMLAWSHDGRWLALDYYPPGQASRYSVLLLGIGPDGALTAPPRVLEAGPQWGWQIEWLPDDRAFTVFGMTGQANQTQVYLVSLREGERPVALTRDDPSTRWGYKLSPDGRYVAYPAEIKRGSSIWRVDLGDVLAPTSRGGGSRRR